MSFSYSRNERLYLQKETTYGQIANTSGTATLAGSNCCRHTKVVLKPNVALLKRRDKTGTRTATQGTPGRKNAMACSVEMDLAANGAPGVVPDCDPILCAIFGVANGTISAGTSVAYALTDAITSFSAWSFRQPSTMMQRVAAGAIVKSAIFDLGADVAALKADLAAAWILDSVNFATTDTTGKSGLTAFPSEPGTPVTNGGITAGFTGVATFDSNVMANIRSAQLKIDTGNDLTVDTFGTYYPGATEGGERTVSLSFNIYDGDDTASSNLYQKAITKTPINITLQIGSVAGAKWTWTIKNVQLATPSMEDGQRKWSAAFGDSRAFGSSLTALDEVALLIS